MIQVHEMQEMQRKRLQGKQPIGFFFFSMQFLGGINQPEGSVGLTKYSVKLHFDKLQKLSRVFFPALLAGKFGYSSLYRTVYLFTTF